MPQTIIRNVALLGADGKLGPAILNALLKRNFQVTVLQRKSSKSPSDYPSGVGVVQVSDEFPVDELVTALEGQDAVVVAIKGSQVDIQRRLADASVKAGVKRFIPADFGSCDSSSKRTQELVPLYKRKTELREYLQHLANENDDFTWTALVVGHFYDWSLEFIHIYPKERRADILDDGNTKFSISSLARIAEATAKVLQFPDRTSNRLLYFQSFCVTQRDIIAAYERATVSKWEVRSIDSKAFEKEHKAKADAGDLDSVEELVWLLGTEDADWTSKKGMQLLELEDEDLDQLTRQALAQNE